MYLSQRSQNRKSLRQSVLAVLLFACVACSPVTQLNPSAPGSSSSSHASPSTVRAVLPGQQVWKQGASSYLFGTNDGYEWTAQNIQTEPGIQEALRSAGITLIRSFFRDNESDAAIEQRIRTIENSGAHCLGVMNSIYDFDFNEHLVGYLGNRCQMYEFGNESDLDEVSVNTYLQLWNRLYPC